MTPSAACDTFPWTATPLTGTGCRICQNITVRRTKGDTTLYIKGRVPFSSSAGCGRLARVQYVSADQYRTGGGAQLRAERHHGLLHVSADQYRTGGGAVWPSTSFPC